MSKVTRVTTKTPMQIQVGGDHYKKFAIQPCVLMLTMGGPAAHIVGYLVREKGRDDLEKAHHWCALAEDLGMQGWVPALTPADPDGIAEFNPPKVISVTEWCWHNSIPANSHLAKALLALEDGDYQSCSVYIDYMIEDRIAAEGEL